MPDSVLEKSCCAIDCLTLSDEFGLSSHQMEGQICGVCERVWAFPTLLVPSLPKILQLVAWQCDWLR